MLASSRPVAVVSCVLALAAGGGCGLEAKPTSGRFVGTAPGVGASRSAFEPETIRLHPLTRLEIDDRGERRIEVFFEPIDRWNHGVKALGVAVLELYEFGGPSPDTRGGSRQLQLWRVDLSDPEANAEPYDRVTRTYHLTLADVPADLPPTRNLELRLRFTTIAGTQVEARYQLAMR